MYPSQTLTFWNTVLQPFAWWFQDVSFLLPPSKPMTTILNMASNSHVSLQMYCLAREVGDRHFGEAIYIVKASEKFCGGGVATLTLEKASN
jgi:hypothetical protein